MERITFIGSLLSLAGVLVSFRMPRNKSPRENGFRVSSGEGRLHGHLKLKGVNANIIDLKVSGKDTNGGLAIFEQTSISKGRGTPIHIHPYQDEVFYVIDGAYYFMVGSEKYHLGPGDSIFLPRNVPHAWTQISDQGKMTVTFQPAGKMEEFFVTMASLEKEPSYEEVIKIFSENGMKVVGPPLKVD